VPSLKVPSETAVRLLNEKIEETEEMLRTRKSLEYYDFVGWCSRVWSLIDEIYGPDCSYPEEIRSMGVPRCTCSGSSEVQFMLLGEYHNRLIQYLDEIQQTNEKQGED
jgi:hypothetical protein